MNRFRVLIREPALIIDAFESGVVMAVALGLFSLHGEQQRDLIAAFIALLAVVKGFSTKPFPVTVIPDFGRAALVFFGSIQLTHLNADQITIVVTFLGTVMTLMQRAQITPVADPVVKLGGAGAGPVAGEAGLVTTNYALAVCLIVVGLIVWALLGSAVLGLILIVVGVVLLFVRR